MNNNRRKEFYRTYTSIRFVIPAIASGIRLLPRVGSSSFGENYSEIFPPVQSPFSPRFSPTINVIAREETATSFFFPNAALYYFNFQCSRWKKQVLRTLSRCGPFLKRNEMPRPFHPSVTRVLFVRLINLLARRIWTDIRTRVERRGWDRNPKTAIALESLVHSLFLSAPPPHPPSN